MILHRRGIGPKKLGYLLFACVCLFVFSHDLQYSAQFRSIQDETGKGVADLVEAGSWVRRVSLIALAGASMISLHINHSSSNLRKRLTGSPAYLLFLFVALLSICWADDPSLTLRRSVEFLLMSASAFVFAQLLDLTDLLKFSFFASLTFIAIGVVAELSLNTFHPASDEYRFCGTLHPNHQAWQCGLLVLSSCALALGSSRRRYLYAVSGIFGFVLLLLTKSRTTLGALVVALLFLVNLGLSKMRRLRLFGFTSLLVAGALSISLLWQSAFADLYKSQLAGRGADSVSTLTGRIPLWSMALQFVSERPWAGYGFHSFWTPAHIHYFSERLKWDVPESHNGYIELLLSLGVVGLSLYLALISRAYMRFYRLARSFPFGPTSFPVALFTFFLLVMFCDVIALDINLVTTVVFAYIWKASGGLGEREVIGPSEMFCQ